MVECIFDLAGMIVALSAFWRRPWPLPYWCQRAARALRFRPTSNSIATPCPSGDAVVRFADNPARIIIDIAQTPTPDGQVVGPIVAGNGFGPILFDPISPHLNGPGIVGSFTLRGFSRGFESSSYVEVRPWAQTIEDHPGSWGGRAFGAREFDEPPPRPAGLTFDPSAPDWADDGPFTPFTTSGYFELEVSGLAPGGWQIAVVPSTGLGCPDHVGQQFRIAEAASDSQSTTVDNLAPMVPFSIDHEAISENDDNSGGLVATVTVGVLGTEWVQTTPC